MCRCCCVLISLGCPLAVRAVKDGSFGAGFAASKIVDCVCTTQQRVIELAPIRIVVHDVRFWTFRWPKV